MTWNCIFMLLFRYHASEGTSPRQAKYSLHKFEKFKVTWLLKKEVTKNHTYLNYENENSVGDRNLSILFHK